MSMNEVEDTARRAGAATTALLTAALAIIEAKARQRADRLRELAARDSEARLRAAQEMRAEATMAAARWRAATRAGTQWIDGYASAVQWRHVDPRAEAAATQIEDSLRRAGIDIPKSTVAHEWREVAADLGVDPVSSDGREVSVEPELGRRVEDPEPSAAEHAAAQTVGHHTATDWSQDQAHWPGFEERVNDLVAQGYDPVATVRIAFEMHEFDTAHSPVALMNWRLDKVMEEGNAARAAEPAAVAEQLLNQSETNELRLTADIAGEQADKAERTAADPAVSPATAEQTAHEAGVSRVTQHIAEAAADAVDPATQPAPRLGLESHPEGTRDLVTAGTSKTGQRRPPQDKARGQQQSR